MMYCLMPAGGSLVSFVGAGIILTRSSLVANMFSLTTASIYVYRILLKSAMSPRVTKSTSLLLFCYPENPVARSWPTNLGVVPCDDVIYYVPWLVFNPASFELPGLYLRCWSSGCLLTYPYKASWLTSASSPDLAVPLRFFFKIKADNF